MLQNAFCCLHLLSLHDGEASMFTLHSSSFFRMSVGKPFYCYFLNYQKRNLCDFKQYKTLNLNLKKKKLVCSFWIIQFCVVGYILIKH